jgi:dynamin 1-like protein
MEDLISTIGRVQDAFSKIGCHDIELPQIVVIGSQSAGKSSVIEGIVKKDFLPRGPGMVTRGPILIQLIKPLDGDNKMKNGDFAVFGHLKDQTFTEFEKVRKEIVNETNRLAPQENDIYTKPINLKIYSSKVVNLSFIDLPGLITITTEKQSDDIVKKIKDLNLTYISNTKSIILVVAQANNDMQNSVGLEFAKLVDKEGDRTLCILTMIDIMSPGTDAKDMLNGKIIPVKRGIVGVVNRNEEDISEGMTIEDCQKEKEKEFFENNYPLLAAKQGAEYLSDSLNKVCRSTGSIKFDTCFSDSNFSHS